MGVSFEYLINNTNIRLIESTADDRLVGLEQKRRIYIGVHREQRLLAASTIRAAADAATGHDETVVARVRYADVLE